MNGGWEMVAGDRRAQIQHGPSALNPVCLGTAEIQYVC